MILLLLLSAVARAELNFQYNLLDNSYFAYERDVGDIDGDGDNDVVAVQEGDTTLQVFRAPSWTRSTLVTFTGSHRYPRADDLKLADVDQDGDLDIVTRLGASPTDDSAGPAVWCENLGGGSNFTVRVIGTSLEYVKDLVAADFDRNGRPDVAMRMDSQTQLWLQETNGDWTEVRLNHMSHEGMEAGDLDMDGDPDLILNGFWFATPNTPAEARVAANYIQRVIDGAWFNQGGDGTANSCKVVAGDFDGDGTNDVAFSQSERAGFDVAWYRSATLNGAGPWIKHPVAPVDYCHNLQAVDFNLDGEVDLLVGGMIQSQHRGLKLMLNQGGGTNWIPFVIQTNGSYSAETGDLDKDGDLDIVGIRNWNSAPTWIYRNNAGGPPSLDFWSYHRVATNHVRTFSLSFPDVDDDGDLDIASGPFVYLNPGSPLTGVWTQVALQNSVHAFATLDVDGDNRADLIAQKDNAGAGRIDLYWVEATNATGTAWATPILIGDVPRGTEPEGFQGYAVAQLVSGERPEVIVNSPQGLYYFTVPTSNPAAGNWLRTFIAPNNSEEGLGVADIDGDGDLDISYTSGGVNEVKWARNPGNGSANWAAFVIGTFPEADWPDRCAAADLNGDGRPDILVTEENSGTASNALACWWEQPASGATNANWTRHIIVTNQYTLNSMDVGDVDRDGDIDVVLAEHRGTKRIAVWANDGQGGFTEKRVGEGNESHLGGRLADLDGDGDLDLASIAYDTYNQLHIWRNDSPGTASPTIVNVTAVNAITVRVRFSEPVEAASAQALTNYAINNGVTISAAVLGADTLTVTLACSTLTGNVTNTLTVNQVTDRDPLPHPIAANSQATFMFISDTAAPVIASVSATNSNLVRILFSEPVEAASAETAAHYTINSGVIISNAVLGSDARTVTLATSTLVGGGYTLIVNNVTDLALPPNVIAPNTQTNFDFIADPIPPAITNVVALDAFNIQLVFNEPVGVTSAQDPRNYTIDNGVAVTWALLEADTRTVTLATTALAGGNYFLTVSNVTDRATPPNRIAPNSQAQFSFIPPSSGTTIFRSSASRVETDNNNAASLSLSQAALTNGYIVVGVSMYDPEATASITAATYGGTTMSLLGTAQSANAYTEVYLFGLAVSNKVAGNYVVSLTASTGIDQLAFGVAAFSNVRQTASTGPFASATGWDVAPSVNVNSVAGDLVVDVLSHDSGSTSVGANQTQIWKQEDNSDQTDGASSREQAVGTTTTMSHTKTVSAPWSLGAVALKGGGAPASEAVPPTITIVAALNANVVRVLFSEPVASVSAQTLANYNFNNGVTLSAAALGPDTRTVTLTTSTLLGGNYTLTVNNVTDRATPANTIAPNSQAAFSFNHPPVAANDNYNVNEDGALNVIAPGILVNDTDANGNNLTASLSSSPAHGTLTLNASGSFTYIPANNYHGADSFTYYALDGTTNSDPATVNLAVLPVNDAPQAANNTYSVNEGAVLSLAAPGVLANDSDLDGEALTAVLETGPWHGALTLSSDGSFSYTSANGYAGPDSFSYRALDAVTNSAMATVSINVLPADRTSPTILSVTATTNQTVRVTFNEPVEAASAQTLTHYAIDNGVTIANAVLDVDSRTVTLTASVLFGGDYTLTVNHVTDLATPPNLIAPDSQALFTFVVDAPVAVSDGFSVSEDSELNVAAPGVLGNDTDADGDALMAALETSPAHGTILLNADGSFAYNPAVNYHGPDGFTYRALDGITNSAVATVTITVVPVNDRPVAVNDSFSVDEDTSLTVNAPGVLSNDTDVDGDPLTAALVTGPSHGSLTLNSDGSFAYTPANDYSGPDAFTYRNLDQLTNSVVAAVSVNIQPVNDAPAAVGDSYSVTQAMVLNLSAPGVLANDIDADGDALTAALGSGPLHGTLTFESNGSFTYAPTNNYIGPDNFSYRALDASTNSAPTTVSLVVVPPDSTPPAIASVIVSNATTVSVLFSEPVESASAQTTANYSINNGVTTSSALLAADTRTVTLTTSTLPFGDYTLTVNNVTDRAFPANAIAPNSQADFSFAPPSAAIAFGSATSKVETDNNKSATLTFAQSALTNGYIVAGVAMYDPVAGASVTAVSYGGTPMALLGTAQSTNAQVEIYLYGLAVSNKVAGNYAVALGTSIGIDQLAFGVAAFSNVRQTASTGPFVSATGLGTAPSVNVGSAAGEMVVDVLGHNLGSSAAGANQTQNWTQEDSTNRIDGASSRKSATSETTTMSHSNTVSTTWSLGAVALKVAPPPPPNTPPSLAAIGNKSVNEGAALSFTATATDPDAGQARAFSLDSGAPAGAAINATNGVFTWTPTEAQGPASYSVTVRVTDSATGTDSETIQITVSEVNAAPLLSAIGNRSANAGVEMTFTANATDSDVPAQVLVFSLDAGAPSGATIDPTSGVFTWTQPQVSTNAVTVRVTDNAGGADFETIQIIATSLPAPWQTTDIGSPAVGSAGHSNGVYTVLGAGSLGGSTDSLRFAYQILSADGEITARVFSMQNTGNSARAGVMIRESLNSDSKHAMMNIAPNGTFRFQRRTSTAGNTSSTTSSSGTFPNAWVRLVRSTNTIAAYRSANGSTWIQVGSANITMAGNVYIGLGVASGNAGTLNTSIFDNVMVVP